MMRRRIAAAAAILLIGSAARLTRAQEWEPIGPDGGDVQSIVVDDHGGVFASNRTLPFHWDAGRARWQALPNGPGGALSVVGQTLYSAYGNASRSDDGGASWIALGKFADFAFDPIAIDPRRPDVLLAAAFDANFVRHLFKSEDGGTSWREVNAGLPTQDYSYNYTILFDPVRPQTVFLGSQISGVYRSSDDGESWTPVNGPLACPRAVPAGGEDSLCLRSLAQGPDGVLYAGAEDGGIYRSDDRAASWQRVAPELANVRAFTLVVHPTDDATVFAVVGGPFPDVGGHPRPGVYRSDDHGESFRLSDDGLPVTGTATVAVDSAHPDTIYAATYRGAYRSVDRGASWQAINDGLYTSCIEGFGFNETTGTLHAIGDARYWRGLDHGAQWQEGDVSVTYAGYPPEHLGQSDRSDVVFDPHDDGALYAYDEFLGPFVSTDDGGTWQPRFISDLEYPTAELEFDRRRSGRLFIATPYSAVQRSDDAGRHWQSVLDSGGGAPGEIEGVAIDASNDDVFALYEHALVLSRDGGDHWQRVGKGLDEDYPSVQRFLVAPTDSPTLLAVSLASGLRVSRDRGHAWSAPNLGSEPGDPAFATAVDPRHAQTIYTTTSTHLFRSDDAGAHWRSVGGQLPAARVYDLAVDPDDSAAVYAATCGAGVQLLRQASTTSPGADTAGCDIRPGIDRDTFWPLAALMILAVLALVHRLRSPD